MTAFVAISIGLGIVIAISATRRVAHYGASGMTAGMAAMMAAMGTGLSVGYAAGMAWDLGWANLIGVLAGGLHGLWMGRRYGPMAALDGAGGGVMGGLMGPMLGVMLLYLPLSLQLTAALMLAVQAAFSAGAVYLVASAAGGTAVAEGWLRVVGRVLGADSAAAVDLSRDHYATLGVQPDATPAEIADAFLRVNRTSKQPDVITAASEALAVLADPLRRARYDAGRLRSEAPAVKAQTRSAHAAVAGAGRRKGAGRESTARAKERHSDLARLLVLVVVGAVAGLVLVAGLSLPLEIPAQSDAGAMTAADQSAVAGTDASGVQQVAMTLRSGRYEPQLVQVNQNTPVRLSLQAIGDPG
jgi:hypothetical protein